MFSSNAGDDRISQKGWDGNDPENWNNLEVRISLIIVCIFCNLHSRIRSSCRISLVNFSARGA